MDISVSQVFSCYSPGAAALLDREFKFDAEQRLIRTTRGNGRTRSTEWMCCGALREVDEDGVLTTHAYNSAKQHLGTTRSAVMDGDTEITPETLTESTTDALGRTVTEYSADGVTSIATTPTAATLITTRNIDGSTASVSGTGQRELRYE